VNVVITSIYCCCVVCCFVFLNLCFNLCFRFQHIYLHLISTFKIHQFLLDLFQVMSLLRNGETTRISLCHFIMILKMSWPW